MRTLRHNSPGNGKPARAVPSLLRRVNVRSVLDCFRTLGPCSRPELTEYTGISAPTMSKLIDDLLAARMIEEREKPAVTAGRPRKVFRLAGRSVHVLGAVIDIGTCAVVSAGLDGKLDPSRTVAFDTPKTYATLLKHLRHNLGEMRQKSGRRCLGLGLSVAGLLNVHRGEIVFSPNLHFLDGCSPQKDLRKALGIDVVMLQEEHGLCLSEQLYGSAQGVDDFAMIDVSAGLGMGVVSGGRYIGGQDGYGGELGHITAVPGGEACGCGNRGCLETVATDRAVADAISRRLGHAVTIGEIIELSQKGRIRPHAELQHAIDHLATGIGIVINIFNPGCVFVYGRMFDALDGLFEELVELVQARSLRPAAKRCSIVRARGSKRLGAVSAIINHCFSNFGPRISEA